ncbi:YHS domain-containing (seleno)protein [uncultured Roseovarius sp.]|uniref:YHS domain-containing (seleno)protein n=1 Tax=uncultured Roseovarius sp. TaxID=293344 RepID=UPI002609FAED|nr:YHS domain-containing (seleno)protein [uncultured Roseovarius sp.]
MAILTRRRAVFGAGAVVAGTLAGLGVSWLTPGFEELAAVPVYAEDGVAIRGTDPVAYFKDGMPVQGAPEHALEWNGATWHFASAENRAAFEADPERYAPQYGGFCAWAVAEKGKLYSTQPENWAIVDDKLYLNFNDDIETRWQEDVPGFIAQGDARWPEILKSKT